MTANKPDKAAALEKLLKEFPREKEAVSWEETYDLLEKLVHPRHAVMLVLRHFGWALVMLAGVGLLLSDKTVVGLLLLGLGMFLVLWKTYAAGKQRGQPSHR